MAHGQGLSVYRMRAATRRGAFLTGLAVAVLALTLTGGGLPA